MIKLLKRYRYWFFIGTVPYLLILLLMVIPTNYSINLPGDIRPIDSVFAIENTAKEEGSFNSVFVITYRNSTPLQNALCQNNDRYDVYENPENDVSDSDDFAQGQISKAVSIKKAIISTYNILEDVEIDYYYRGQYVYQLIEGTPNNDNELKIGDVIVGTSYENVRTTVTNAYNEQLPLDILRMKDGVMTPMQITPTVYNAYFVEKYDYYEITNIEPTYTVRESFVGGDSGGLLQALSTYNKLTDFDYTLGLTIAGTGAIELDGTVSPIGSIKQKIFTADRRGVDVFFCPSIHYDEALIAYNQTSKAMKIVSVASFQEAIDYLETLALEMGIK